MGDFFLCQSQKLGASFQLAPKSCPIKCSRKSRIGKKRRRGSRVPPHPELPALSVCLWKAMEGEKKNRVNREKPGPFSPYATFYT